MRRGAGAWKVAGVLALVATGGAVEAQSLENRVDAEGDGWIIFQVPVSEGVEVCDRAIRIRDVEGRDDSHWRWGGHNDGVCGPGPMQVELERRGGRIRSIRVRRVRALEEARSLGLVDPGEASDFLVTLAYQDADPKVAEQGFFLARLPRGADPAAGIVRAARDRELPSDVRRSALFWAGQMAADQVLPPLAEVAREDGEESVREAAVFALSQHEGGRALEVLMELATDAPHGETRRAALFWLAQRDEPEAADFLASLILARGGG